jgi:hypothetical protein
MHHIKYIHAFKVEFTIQGKWYYLAGGFVTDDQAQSFIDKMILASESPTCQADYRVVKES